MRLFGWFLALTLLLPAANALADQDVHVVADGQTLGRIAKRYNLSIEELCKANGITRREKIKPGQKLVIPSPGEDPAPAPKANADSKPEPAPERQRDEKDEETKNDDVRLSGGMRLMELPNGGRAYYFEPTGPGRRSLKPVIVYLHGRGGHPEADCRRWAPIARPFGWLACPVGPVEHNGGRAWNNNWASAQRFTMGAIAGLRERYGRRIQLWGNTLIGFSEGAYAAMNVGVREPRTFNRWLILAANSTYWGGPGLEALGSARDRVRRVYLITGENDGVVDGTREVESWLKKAGVATRVTTPNDMGHEVLLERKAFMYSEALRWLDRGPPSKGSSAGATASR
jgi:predicted esterase